MFALQARRGGWDGLYAPPYLLPPIYGWSVLSLAPARVKT
jgi:hypothetical protein